MTERLVGRTIGKYHLQEEIGRGGMSLVFRGLDTTLDRVVAVKVLPPELAWDKEFVERFLHEARTAARLKHPNIVTIYEVGHANRYHYIAMEYLDGNNIAQLIRQRGRALPPEQVAHIVIQVARALDYAHGQDPVLVHRDIKPENIVVSPTGHATLMDFGLVRAMAGTRLTRAGTVLGTPAYMSPEQVGGRELSPASDIYSLGLVAYEMLAGALPFQADTAHAVLHAQVYDAARAPRELNPALPPPVDAVVLSALSKEPAERWPAAGAFADALAKALQGIPVPAPLLAATAAQSATATGAVAAVAATAEPAGPRRVPGWLLIGALVPLILVAAIIFGLRGRNAGDQRANSGASGAAGPAVPSTDTLPLLTETDEHSSIVNTSVPTIQPTLEPTLTAAPPTATPTAVPPATVPATAVPPTQAPATAIPPTAPPAPPVQVGLIQHFAAEPPSINQPGECTTLVWDVAGADGVFLASGQNRADSVDIHGRREECLQRTTTFTLTAWKGETKDERTITVAATCATCSAWLPSPPTGSQTWKVTLVLVLGSLVGLMLTSDRIPRARRRRQWP